MRAETLSRKEGHVGAAAFSRTKRTGGNISPRGANHRSLKLAFFAQVGLELGEHAQHVEEALARRGAGVDRLLSRLEGRALGLHSSDDVLKIADDCGRGGRSG